MQKKTKKPISNFATKEDIEELAGITNRSLERELQPVHGHLAELGEQITDLQAGQKRLESGIQAILKHIESTDETLREHKTHPERIARLERSVFR